MSKKPKKPVKNFNYSPTETLPKLKNIKTEWDFKKLYYKSEKDPQIEKDVQKTIQAYKNFAKTYRKKPFTSSVKVLRNALQELERITGMPETSKPGRYFSFRQAIDVKDDVAEKQLALLSDRLTKAGNELLFFELELGKISKQQQKVFLSAGELAHFRYYLDRVFLEAKHDLSEAEEKILNLTSGPAYDMWVAATEKIISNRSVVYKKKRMALNEALESLNSLPSKEKPRLWNLILDEMEQISEVVENEFNAIVTEKKVEDELREYEKPYSATVLGYEDDMKSVEALVEAVSDKGFTLSKKFYQLKAKYHGKKTLDYSQKYDSIGKIPNIPFGQAVEICRDVFYGVKNDYGQVFDDMLEGGQIDVYPKQGKRGGAFMSDAVNLPTQVFLNQTDDLRSLQTLAHEMGHAIHGARSKKQKPFYQGHSITTAETASTLFENLLFSKLYEQATPAEQKVLLHDRISQNIATIQRQIAFFNFELELHNTVRQNGATTKEELRDMMQKHLQAYLGKAVSVSAKDGYSYVYISHFRYGFYVYTYTFGILMSNLIATNYKADASYVKEIDKFLSAGRSDTVANIFASIGLVTSKIDTFLLGLKELENDIASFGKIVNTKC